MKVTIATQITGIDYDDFNEKYKSVIDSMTLDNIDIVNYDIDSMDINPCIGFFSCWVKTPGKCVFDDDMNYLLKDMITSDWFIMITTIKAGTIPYKSKNAIDRNIPAVMPYIGIYSGECHHHKRYESYPNRAMLIIEDDNSTDEAMDILKCIAEKNALNMHAEKMVVQRVNTENIKEYLYEIINS